MKTPQMFLLLLSGITYVRLPAQSPVVFRGDPRTITTTGEGTVQVAPDTVVVELQTITENPDLMAAKRGNDLRIKKVQELANRYDLKSADVRIEYASIERVITRDKKDRQRQVNYIVKKRVKLLIRDLNRFEPLLNELLNAGVNELDKVEFQNSHSETFAMQAKGKAVLAARENASAMALLLGQKLGKPQSIIEPSDTGESYAGGSQSGSIGTDLYSKETIVPETAAGTLSYTARVTVVFELE